MREFGVTSSFCGPDLPVDTGSCAMSHTWPTTYATEVYLAEFIITLRGPVIHQHSDTRMCDILESESS